jgi:ankyrin repeat protein
MDYSYGQTYFFVNTPVMNVTKFIYMLSKKINLESVLSYIDTNPFEMNTYVKGGMTPLMLLAKYSNDPYYQSVFDKILPLVDVDIKDSSNNTALMYAIISLGNTI